MVKEIHYIWFGGKPLPQGVKACIRSWQKFCPDWKIIQWDETNFPIDKYRWVREALDHKCYAFASDCARLIILANRGGLYVDTDLEMTGNPENLLISSFVSGVMMSGERLKDVKYLSHDGIDSRDGKKCFWFKIQSGIMYSDPQHPYVVDCIHNLYGDGQKQFWNSDDTHNGQVIDWQLMRRAETFGIKYVNERQMGDHGVLIYDASVFATRNTRNENTVAIHWFDQSWDNRGGFKMKIKKYIKKYLWFIYRMQ